MRNAGTADASRDCPSALVNDRRSSASFVVDNQSRDRGDAVRAAKGRQRARCLTTDPRIPMVGRDPIQGGVGRRVPVIADRPHGRFRNPSIVLIHGPVGRAGLRESRQKPDALGGVHVASASRPCVRPRPSDNRRRPSAAARPVRQSAAPGPRRSCRLREGSGPVGGVICGRSSR